MRRRKDGKIVGERDAVYLKVGRPEQPEVVVVEGTVYGHLAVHEKYDPYLIWEKTKLYQVTHIPTGRKLPGDWPKQNQARALAQALQDPSEGLDWNFDSEGQMPAPMRKRVRQITTALMAEYGNTEAILRRSDRLAAHRSTDKPAMDYETESLQAAENDVPRLVRRVEELEGTLREISELKGFGGIVLLQARGIARAALSPASPAEAPKEEEELERRDSQRAKGSVR